MERIAKVDNEGSTADKYIGYSSAICNLDGDDFNGLEYVFGGPRGHLYSGEVTYYTYLIFIITLLLRYTLLAI